LSASELEQAHSPGLFFQLSEVFFSSDFYLHTKYFNWWKHWNRHLVIWYSLFIAWKSLQ